MFRMAAALVTALAVVAPAYGVYAQQQQPAMSLSASDRAEIVGNTAKLLESR